MKKRKFELNLKTLISFLFFSFIFTRLSAQQYVYWTEYTYGTNNTKIACVKTDGTNYSYITLANNTFPQGLIIYSNYLCWNELLPAGANVKKSFWSPVSPAQVVGSLSSCRSMAIDDVNDQLYWAASQANANKISRSNIDGTGITDLISFGGGNYNIRQVAIDVPGNKMYWADFSRGVIGKANLDGSGSSGLVTGGEGKGYTGVALDPVNGRIYWTEINQNQINSIKTDGTGLASGLSGLDRPQYISYDNGKLYWTEAGNTTQSIKSADINSSGVISGVTTLHSASNPGGITIGVPPVALPIELASFSARINSNVVELSWKTSTEINSYGFDVERKDGKWKMENGKWNLETGWEKIGFVRGAGNSSSLKYYSFPDKNITSAGTYIYRLKKIDNDGTYNYSDEVEVNAEKLIPSEYALYNNYPNPFNPSTHIKYSLPEKGEVNLSVYNVVGQKVAELVNKEMNEGIYEVEFNASNFSSGVYIYKLTVKGKALITKRMVLLK